MASFYNADFQTKEKSTNAAAFDVVGAYIRNEGLEELKSPYVPRPDAVQFGLAALPLKGPSTDSKHETVVLWLRNEQLEPHERKSVPRPTPTQFQEAALALNRRAETIKSAIQSAFQGRFVAPDVELAVWPIPERTLSSAQMAAVARAALR
ncbi:MAG: hypothetical protein L6R40_006819 [Gallowayella cf. fulva]|nr:MAG: hypothetical protein L6R40_006819 [Xanthomendoza cf. fulva]